MVVLGSSAGVALVGEQRHSAENPLARRVDGPDLRGKPAFWIGGQGLCTGGLDVIRKEAWPSYRTISSVRLCWELEQPQRPEGLGENLM